jgi:hypothetical protein
MGIFLFTTAFRPALGPTQSPIQWVTGTLSLGVKRQEREADHSLPSSAEIKIHGAILPLPNTPSWRGAQLYHQQNGHETLTWKWVKSTLCLIKRHAKHVLKQILT